MCTSSSTSHLMLVSSRDSGNRSSAARRFSPTLPLISAAAAMMPSRLPYSFNHLAAVFGPTLSTPGMLSTVSPMTAR